MVILGSMERTSFVKYSFFSKESGLEDMLEMGETWSSTTQFCNKKVCKKPGRKNGGAVSMEGSLAKTS